MDKINSIGGTINNYGRKILNTIPEPKNILFWPTCATIEPLLNYSVWAILIVVVLLIFSMVAQWSRQTQILFTLLLAILAVYMAYINYYRPSLFYCLNQEKKKK